MNTLIKALPAIALFSLPVAAFAQSSDVAYCKALVAKYEQYLDQSSFGVLDLSGRATGGAFHPTAEGHAMIANDATVELCQRIGCGP